MQVTVIRHVLLVYDSKSVQKINATEIADVWSTQMIIY